MAAAMEVDGPARPDINATGSYATFLPYNADGALDREAAAYLDEITDGLAQSVLDNDPAGIVHGVKTLSRYGAPGPWPWPRPSATTRSLTEPARALALLVAPPHPDGWISSTRCRWTAASSSFGSCTPPPPRRPWTCTSRRCWPASWCASSSTPGRAALAPELLAVR